MSSFNGNLIINADDFGYSDKVNQGVMNCLEKGFINSASLMPNTDSFEDAVAMVHEKGYLDCMGVHVNLTEGKPLTNFGHSPYLRPDGYWDKDRVSAMRCRLPGKIRDDFSAEIIAQIRAVEKSGIHPTHINSHHHIHVLPAFFPVFLEIGRSYGYKLRIAQTHSNRNFLKLAYRRYINRIIKSNGLNFSDYFETVESYIRRTEKFRTGVVEIMVHPSVDAHSLLYDVVDKGNTEKLINTIYLAQ